MSRFRFVALLLPTVLASAPKSAGAQGVPISPVTPKITLTPDLAARLDDATRIVFKKESMRVADDGTTAVRATAPFALCAGLTAGQRRDVAVPPLRWGVANGVVANGTVASVATPFVVSLSYTTISNGLVAERVASEQVASLAAGATRFFQFTDPARPTTYTVSLFREPARRFTNTGAAGTKPNRDPEILRTFCVPSIDAVDHAMVITADPAGRVTDSNRSNNVLRLP